MRNTIAEGVWTLLAFGGLGLLAFAQRSPNEKAPEVQQFQVGRLVMGPGSSPLTGVMTAGLAMATALTGVITITGGTISYERDGHLEQADANQPRRPQADYWEVRVQDIAEIKGEFARTFQIKFHDGRTYKFCALNQKGKCGARIGPVVEALSAALSAPPPPEQARPATIPPAVEGLTIDPGSAELPRGRFAPIPPPDGHTPAETETSGGQQRVSSSGSSVVLTDPQKASLLGSLGRYQEAANLYRSLGRTADQEIWQDALALQESLATSGRTSPEIDYRRGHFSEALSEAHIVIAALRERLSNGLNASSIEASNLASDYDLRAQIKFALGDYPGALDDSRAAQHELAEAQSVDRDGGNASTIAQYSEDFTQHLVIIHLLQGEQGAGCTLFKEKGILHSTAVVYPNAVAEVCGSPR